MNALSLAPQNVISLQYFCNLIACHASEGRNPLAWLENPLSVAPWYPTRCSLHTEVQLLKILYCIIEVHLIYWKWDQPDNENQSDGRTATIDPNSFKSSQSNVQYKLNLNLFVAIWLPYDWFLLPGRPQFQ